MNKKYYFSLCGQKDTSVGSNMPFEQRYKHYDPTVVQISGSLLGKSYLFSGEGHQMTLWCLVKSSVLSISPCTGQLPFCFSLTAPQGSEMTSLNLGVIPGMKHFLI